MFDWKDLRTALLGALICFIAGLIWTTFVKYTANISFTQAWNNVINTDIKLWFCLLVVIFSVIITTVISRPKINKKIKSEEARKEQIKKINSVKYDDKNILFKWSIYFDGNKPFITDLVVYCTNHPPVPVKFLDYTCPMNNCENNDNHINMNAAENHIQSLIDYHWDEINGVNNM